MSGYLQKIKGLNLNIVSGNNEGNNFPTQDELVGFKQLTEVTIQKSLGEGNYGTVCLAAWQGVKVAAKKLKGGEDEWKAFSREAKILSYVIEMILTFIGHCVIPMYYR